MLLKRKEVVIKMSTVVDILCHITGLSTSVYVYFDNETGTDL